MSVKKEKIEGVFGREGLLRSSARYESSCRRFAAGAYGAAEPGDYPHLSWPRVTASRQSGLCSGPRRPPHLRQRHGAGTPPDVPPPRCKPEHIWWRQARARAGQAPRWEHRHRSPRPLPAQRWKLYWGSWWGGGVAGGRPPLQWQDPCRHGGHGAGDGGGLVPHPTPARWVGGRGDAHLPRSMAPTAAAKGSPGSRRALAEPPAVGPGSACGEETLAPGIRGFTGAQMCPLRFPAPIWHGTARLRALICARD